MKVCWELQRWVLNLSVLWGTFWKKKGMVVLKLPITWPRVKGIRTALPEPALPGGVKYPSSKAWNLRLKDGLTLDLPRLAKPSQRAKDSFQPECAKGLLLQARSEHFSQTHLIRKTKVQGFRRGKGVTEKPNNPLEILLLINVGGGVEI